MTLPETVAEHRSRRERILAHLDVRNGRGLEIGPLDRPVALKAECDVRYADIHLAPGLKAFYATHPGYPVEDIVDVDFALIRDGRTLSLAEATAGAAPFDWVVASHVIEHVADLVGWLRDVAAVLRDRGRLALAIPDRRYCSDALRPPTTVGEMLLAHHHRDERPSVRAIFDHFHEAVRVTPEDVWAHGPPGRDRIIFPLAMPRDMVRRSLDDGEYVDCHVWLFTPPEFVRQMGVLAELGHIEFTVAEVEPTAVDDMEFFVTLERLPRDLDAATREAQVAGGFALPSDTAAAPRTTMAVSPLEQRLIERKRRVMEHRGAQRARGLLLGAAGLLRRTSPRAGGGRAPTGTGRC